MDRFVTTVAAAALSLLIGAAGAGGARAAEATLEIIVDGIKTEKGQIFVGVFTNADTFKSGVGAVAEELIPVDGDTVSVTFTGLESGIHAIKLFHDVNGNGDLDTNFVGIPTEPFGFSNNAVARFGPPNFDKTRFDLAEGKNKHVITLTPS